MSDNHKWPFVHIRLVTLGPFVPVGFVSQTRKALTPAQLMEECVRQPYAPVCQSCISSLVGNLWISLWRSPRRLICLVLLPAPASVTNLCCLTYGSEPWSGTNKHAAIRPSWVRFGCEHSSSAPISCVLGYLFPLFGLTAFWSLFCLVEILIVGAAQTNQ